MIDPRDEPVALLVKAKINLLQLLEKLEKVSSACWAEDPHCLHYPRHPRSQEVDQIQTSSSQA
jgi:hypothetical protein